MGLPLTNDFSISASIAPENRFLPGGFAAPAPDSVSGGSLSDPQNASPFNFETRSGQEAVLETAEPAGSAPLTADDEKLRMAVEASGLATYHWNIETDEIVWSPNAMEVLGADLRGFSNGRSFASFLDPDNFTSRYDTVMRSAQADDGGGVAFQIEYKFRPEGHMAPNSVWLEDNGRWFGGQEGRPRGGLRHSAPHR